MCRHSTAAANVHQLLPCVGYSGGDGVPGADPAPIKLQKPTADAGRDSEGSLVQTQQPAGVVCVTYVVMYCCLTAYSSGCIVVLLKIVYD
jgi:hypothetical protein